MSARLSTLILPYITESNWIHSSGAERQLELWGTTAIEGQGTDLRETVGTSRATATTNAVETCGRQPPPSQSHQRSRPNLPTWESAADPSPPTPVQAFLASSAAGPCALEAPCSSPGACPPTCSKTPSVVTPSPPTAPLSIPSFHMLNCHFSPSLCQLSIPSFPHVQMAILPPPFPHAQLSLRPFPCSFVDALLPHVHLAFSPPTISLLIFPVHNVDSMCSAVILRSHLLSCPFPLFSLIFLCSAACCMLLV